MVMTDELELLARYLAHDLTTAEHAEVERHLLERLDLREALEQLRAVDAAVAELPKSTVTNAHAVALVDAVLSSPSKRRFSREWAMAASLLLVAAAWFTFGHERRPLALTAVVERVSLNGRPVLNATLSAGDVVTTDQRGIARIVGSLDVWLGADAEFLLELTSAPVLSKGVLVATGEAAQVRAGAVNFTIAGQAIISMEPATPGFRGTGQFDPETFLKSRTSAVGALALSGAVAVTLFVVKGSVSVATSDGTSARIISAPGQWSSQEAKPAPTPSDFAGADGGLESHDESGGVLEVTVLGSGAAIESATLKLFQFTGINSATQKPVWRLIRSGTTGADGRARWPAKPGAYAVSVNAKEWPTTTREVQRPTGQTVTKVDFVLEAGTVLRGRTEDGRTHQPVAPATIEINQTKLAGVETVTVSVDEHGRFVTAPLQPGEWSLRGIAEGQGSAQMRVETPSTSEAKLVFRASGFVEGYVQWPDGGAAAGAQVMLVGDDTLTTESSASGAFSLESPPGTWRARAQAGTAVGSAEQPAIVQSAKTSPVGVIRLGDASLLSGQVRVGTTTVANAVVQITPHRATGEVGRAETDASGRYSVALAPGIYDVDVLVDGESRHEVHGVLVDGSTTLDITLEPNGTIHGRVLGAAAASESMVRLVKQFQKTARTTVTHDGEFTFKDVRPGRWLVSAPESGDVVSPMMLVTVVAGQTAEVELVRKRTTLVTGSIKWACKGPAKTVELFFTPNSKRTSTGVVRKLEPPDYRFEMQLPPDDYLVFASAEGRGCNASDALNVREGDQVPLELTVKSKPVPMEIRVFERDGRPSPDAMVTVMDANNHNAGTNMLLIGQTDDDGVSAESWHGEPTGPVKIVAVNGERMAMLENVKQGTKQVTLTLTAAASLTVTLVGLPAQTRASIELTAVPSFSFEDTIVTLANRVHIDSITAGRLHVSVQAGDLGGAGEVTLEPGERGALTVSLTRGATISGRLIDTAGQPRSGWVGLLSPAGEEMSEAQAVDDNGHFELKAVPPGAYLLTVMGEHHQVPVKVTEGQTLSVGELRLAPSKL